MSNKKLIIGIVIAAIIISGTLVTVFFVFDPFSKVKTVWVHETDEGHYYSSPLLYQDRVYIGGGPLWFDENGMTEDLSEYNVYCLDKTTGNQVWKYSLNWAYVRCGPVLGLVEDGYELIYFIAEGRNETGYRTNQVLYALNFDGTLNWSQIITPQIPINEGAGALPSDQQGSFSHGAGSIVVDKSGRVLTGGDGIHCFNGANGIALWHIDAGYVLYGAVAVGDKYYTSNYSLNMLIDIPTGNVTHTYSTFQYGQIAYPSVDSDKNIISGTNRGKVVKFSPTLELVWEYGDFGLNQYGNYVSLYSNPAIDSQNNIYIGTKNDHNSKIFALSSEGNLLWETTDEIWDVYCSPCLGNDGKIYIATEGMAFYILEKDTGEIIYFKRIFSDDVTWSSPVIDENGYLYIGNMGGNLNALKIPATGMDLTAPWMCRGGSSYRQFSVEDEV
ncbi:MAG: PQQ-binding-like beta-propeller repeat protein [Candidatus Thorarchaeota archaeon]